jgi:hypothetical protein
MPYFLTLFTPGTWEAFRKEGANVASFNNRQENRAKQVKKDDVFLFYIGKGISRLCGAARVIAPYYQDKEQRESITPDKEKSHNIRFDIEPLICLDIENSIPIKESAILNALSMVENKKSWGLSFISALRTIPPADGDLLMDLLRAQAGAGRVAYPLSEEDQRRLAQQRTVRAPSGPVAVAVPESEEEDGAPAAPEARPSIQIQARLAEMGAAMGFRIWVPRGDRERVLDCTGPKHRKAFVDSLPLNYDDVTLRTIENIDVLWLRGRSMVRAFEVEHTTAIYSGLLRMADLLALQPNMDIRAHIVAPAERREKVLSEIKRPVFSLLERGPLYQSCTFLTYEAVGEVAQMPHLAHTKDGVLDDYAESAEEA